MPVHAGTWPGSFAERFVPDRTPRKSSNNFHALVAASLALLLTTTGIGGTNQDTTQPRSLASAGIGEINVDPVAITGKIEPAFFENLRSVDSKDGAVFHVGEVRFFPDRVTVTLLIIGPFTTRARASGPDAQYMEGMKFKAEWKRGVELRFVKAFRQLTATVTEPPDVLWLVKECLIYEL